MEESQTEGTVQEALMDLYLNVKIRSAEEINSYTESKLEEERESLKCTDPLVLIEYIRTSIEILLNMRNEENALIKLREETASVVSDSSIKEIPKAYEQQIQKLEEELEQQLKLHIDAMQDKEEVQDRQIEELSNDIKRLKEESGELERNLRKKILENDSLKAQLSGLENKMKQEEKIRQNLERELSKKSPLAGEYEKPLIVKPGLATLNVDIRKPLNLAKNNLTERTTNSSSHLKSDYSGNNSTKKGLAEIASMRDLKKQIGRSATPYIQEMYRKNIQKAEPAMAFSIGRSAIKSRKANRSIAGQIQNLTHLRSKSHSNLSS